MFPVAYVFRKTEERTSPLTDPTSNTVCKERCLDIARRQSEITVSSDASSVTSSDHSGSRTVPEKKSIPTSYEAAKNAEELSFANSLIFNKDAVLKLPSFQMNEIALGKILGRGGFYDVLAIKHINISVNQTTPNSGHGAEEEGRDTVIMAMDTVGARESMMTTCHKGQDDTTTTNNYVIKCIKPSIVKHKTKYLTAIKDSVIETYILSNLHHPHIIKMRGVVMCNIDDSDSSFKERRFSARYCQDAGYRIVMDRIYGTLDKKLKQWRTQSKSLLGLFFANNSEKMFATQVRMASQLSEALTYLHKLNIVYRDIKPENIGFDLNGDLKIFDFGLAKELRPDQAGEDGSYNLSLAGTARYMAPEIVRGERYNQSVDVYSYGILLWEIFALKKPFQGFDMSDILSQAKGKRVQLRMPPSMPPSIKSLIRESCQFKWKARPTFEMLSRKIQTNLIKTS